MRQSQQAVDVTRLNFSSNPVLIACFLFSHFHFAYVACSRDGEEEAKFRQFSHITYIIKWLLFSCSLLVTQQIPRTRAIKCRSLNMATSRLYSDGEDYPSSAFEFKPAQQHIGAIAKFQAREAEENSSLTGGSKLSRNMAAR